jgi:hypothetical protein
MYYAAAFIIGVALSFVVAHFLSNHELGYRGAIVTTLCWNVLFMLVLPLVLDWSERKHFKARFIKLEEVSASNPELAAILSEQCEKHSIQRLRLAVVDSQSEEPFSYTLCGNNPRLVVSGSLFNSHEKASIMPSIEAVLARAKSQNHALVFMGFAIAQIALHHAVLALLQH